MLEVRRQSLLRALAEVGDCSMTPEELLVRLPAEKCLYSPGGKPAAWLHPLRESLCYALVLLEQASRSRQGLAEQIIGRVTGLQRTQNRALAGYGCWTCFLEETRSPQPKFDIKWAALNGFVLGVIWRRHYRRLSVASLFQIEKALLCAADAVRDRIADSPSIAGCFLVLQVENIKVGKKITSCALHASSIVEDALDTAIGLISEATLIDELMAFSAIRCISLAPRNARLTAPILRRLETKFRARIDSQGFERDADKSKEDMSLLTLMLERAVDCPTSDDPRRCYDMRAALACVMTVWMPGESKFMLGGHVARELKYVVH